MAPEQMEEAITSIGRVPRQRTTLYADAPTERASASFAAPILAPLVQSPAVRRALTPATR
jgi:FO synthase